jgi:hypothetical protein
MAIGLNDFDGAKSITRALERMNTEKLFGAQMSLVSLVAISGPGKVSIFRAHPALLMDLPASKS